MREHITISELARLMNVSTHQIRYFEEKEVLLPHIIDENGYRLYGLNEIYKLAHILLLRKFNLPVNSIKMCFNNYTIGDYTQLLNTSVDCINEQINNLIALRDFTMSIIEKINMVDISKDKYIIKDIEKRNLKQIFKMNYQVPFSAKQFYDIMSESNKTLSLYETDIINLYDNTNVYICIGEDEKNFDISHKLVAGEYLCYEFLAENDEEFENQISKFFEYAKVNSINIKGNLVAIENSMISIFYNNGIYYELQMLIEKNSLNLEL